MQDEERRRAFLESKVPAVTFGFWIIKILATTLGEIGGDAVTMSWLGETTPEANPNGYLIGTIIFAIPLALLVWGQIKAPRFNAWLYWATIIASTTCGTTLADFADRAVGIGYTGGASILLACVLLSLAAWRLTLGTIDVNSVRTPKTEMFYWITITFSQTLGTALGDWVADTNKFGFGGGAFLFGALLLALALLYFFTRMSRVFLFWAAFILTRPLGATLGDLMDKPLAQGGFGLNRSIWSAVLFGTIILLVFILPQRPGRHPGETLPAEP